MLTILPRKFSHVRGISLVPIRDGPCLFCRRLVLAVCGDLKVSLRIVTCEREVLVSGKGSKHTAMKPRGQRTDRRTSNTNRNSRNTQRASCGMAALQTSSRWTLDLRAPLRGGRVLERQRYAHPPLQAPQHQCVSCRRGASRERRVGRRVRGPRLPRRAPRGPAAPWRAWQKP